MRHIILFASVATFTWACSNSPDKGKDTPAAITDAVQKYNITPIFPFRQDVWMGDVFITALSYKEWKRKVLLGEPVPTSVRVRRIDLSEDLAAFQRNSPQFTSTNEPLRARRQFQWRGRSFTLNPVAAPAFGAFSKSNTSGGLSGSVGIGSGWLSALFAREAKYTISVPEMLSVAIPSNGNQLRAAFASRGDLLKLTGAQGSALYSMAGCRDAYPLARNAEGLCTVTVSVVVDVFMARDIAIDVTSGKSLGFTGGVRAGVPGTDVLAAATNGIRATLRNSQISTLNTLDETLKNNGATAKLSTKIRNTLNQSLERSQTAADKVLDNVRDPVTSATAAVPLPGLGQLGGHVSTSSVSGKSASLIISLDEPVTIGYRGFAVQFVIDSSGRQVGLAKAINPRDVAPAAPAQ